MPQSHRTVEELTAQLNTLTAKSLEGLNTNRELTKRLHDYHCKLMDQENTIDALTTTFENNNIYLQHLTSLNHRSELFDSQLETFDRNNKVTKMSANRATILESSLNWRTTETTFDNLCLEYDYLTEQLRIANDTTNTEYIDTSDNSVNHSFATDDHHHNTNEYNETFNSTTTHDSVFSSNEYDQNNTTISSKNSDDLSKPLTLAHNGSRKRHILKKDSFLQIPFSIPTRQPKSHSKDSDLDTTYLRSFHIDSHNRKEKSKEKKAKEEEREKSKLLMRPLFPTIEEVETPTDDKVNTFIEEQSTLANHNIQIKAQVQNSSIMNNTPAQNKRSLYVEQETPVDKVDLEYLRAVNENMCTETDNSHVLCNSIENGVKAFEKFRSSSLNEQPTHSNLQVASNDKLLLSPHNISSDYESSSNQSDQESGYNRNSMYSDNSYGCQDAEPFNLEEMLEAAANENFMNDMPNEGNVSTGTSTQIYRSRSHESVFSMAPTLTLCSSSATNTLSAQIATPTTMFSSSSVLDQPLSLGDSKKNNSELKNQTMKWLKLSNSNNSTSISPLIGAQITPGSQAPLEVTRDSFASQNRASALSSKSNTRSSKDILNSISTSDRLNRLWLSSPFASTAKKLETTNGSAPLQIKPVVSSSIANKENTINTQKETRLEVTNGIMTHINPIPITATRSNKDTSNSHSVVSSKLSSTVSNNNITNNSNTNNSHTHNAQWKAFVTQLIPNSSMVYTETGKFVGKPCSSTTFNNSSFVDPMTTASPSTKRTGNADSFNKHQPSLFKKVGNSSDRQGSFNGSHSTLYLAKHGSKIVRHGGDSMSQSVLSSRVSHAALRDALHSSFV